MADAAHSSQSHAANAIDVRGVAVGAAIVAGAIAFAIVSSYIAIHAGSAENAISFFGAERSAPPEVASFSLQPRPGADIVAFRAEKDRLLETYAWIDRTHGIVRIPIERAMALAAGAIPKQPPPR
jgi:hypothetical protein